jgi:menaquinol-cytochrome c reductase iron-sulfur subunit
LDQSQPAAGSRRRFLKLATAALGGAVGAVLGLPLIRYFVYPVGRQVVSSPEEPIEVIAADALKAGGPPVQVALVASQQRDGWGVRDGARVGSAWVSKDAAGQVSAFSATCPHLGCAIGYEPGADVFKCPCHKSEFTRAGDKTTGPSKRGLDPLPCKVEDGRVKLTFVRFVSDIADRIKA